MPDAHVSGTLVIFGSAVFVSDGEPIIVEAADTSAIQMVQEVRCEKDPITFVPDIFGEVNRNGFDVASTTVSGECQFVHKER